MLTPILLTFLSGVVGTALGGVISITLKLKTKKSLVALLAFSAGMMISMICFDLLPEAIEQGGLLVAITGLIIGVLVLLLLDGKFHHHHDDDETESENLHHHEHHVDPNQKMVKLGMMMIGSVALHNFPEGLAIGSSTTYEAGTGLLMAILLTLHNIPEGMGMISPLLNSGMKKSKALFLVALSGGPTLLGGILGYAFGGFSESTIAFTLALAAGCMMYVTYYEILPQVQLLDSGRKPQLYQLAGFVVGLVIITFMEH